MRNRYIIRRRQLHCKAADLEQPFPKNGVFSREQPASHIGVSHLQEMELWGQGEADALLCQQCPASSPWPSGATLCAYSPENSITNAEKNLKWKTDLTVQVISVTHNSSSCATHFKLSNLHVITLMLSAYSEYPTKIAFHADEISRRAVGFLAVQHIEPSPQYASSPDDQRVSLRNADGVLVNKVIELGGDSPEVEVGKAAAHTVLPDLL